MPKTKKAAKEESDSDDDELTWKPSWQKDEERKAKPPPTERTTSAPSSAKKPLKGASKAKSSSRLSSAANSDDDDDSTPPQSASTPRLQNVSLDDEKEEDDEDGDQWRLSNRTVTSKHKADPAYIKQAELWKRFRVDFPVPLRSPLTAGHILALRRQLKGKKKLVVQGIPIHLRRDVWEILSGARAFPEKMEGSGRYQHYLKHPPPAATIKSINADVGRAMRGHMKFTTKTGKDELSRVLTAFATRVPAVGYNSAMSHVAAFLLLFYPEERAFWMMCSLIDIILPQDYYTNSLLGARADAQLVKILVFQRLSRLHNHLNKHNMDVSIVALRWLMPLYLTTLPLHVCIRLFDILMLEGANWLISIALALLHIHQKKILAINDSAELFDYIANLGGDEKTLDPDTLIQQALQSKCAVSEEELKRRDVERRIMESAYMKELAASMKYKQQEEERRKKEEEQRRQAEEDEEQALSFGTEMWKIGAQGKPRKTKVYLHNESRDEKDREKRIYTLTWDSKSKPQGEARLLLRDCSLYCGLEHGQFSKRPDMRKQWDTAAKRAWSVVGVARSLDLVCVTEYDFEEWMKVMRRVPMRTKEWAKMGGKGSEAKIERIAIGADETEEKMRDGSGKRSGRDSGRKLVKTSIVTAAASSGGGSTSAINKPKLSRLQQARAERDAQGDGPAANKLAALLKHPPADDFSLSSDDEPAPVKKKK